MNIDKFKIEAKKTQNKYGIIKKEENIFTFLNSLIQKTIEAIKIKIVTNPRNMFLNPKKTTDHMPLKKSCKKKAVVPKFCVFILKL